jgi:hypothetical protein
MESLMHYDEEYMSRVYFEEVTGLTTRIRASRYDWCFSSGNNQRTPDEYPYSFDTYYLWRDFEESDMEGIDSVYSDRMRDWEPEKFKAALEASGKGWIDRMTKERAKTFIKVYYDGKYECVGFGRGCNVSNGYPLGIFFLKEKKAKKKRGS